MKAAICTTYGGPEVVKILEVPKPTPKPNQVLIKVMASAVNSGDVRVRGLQVEGFLRIVMRFVLGFTKPRQPILGVVVAGVVESIGSKATQFKPGDAVYGMAGFSFGGHAEYVALSEKRALALLPKGASFEEAAALPFGGTTALYFLHKAGLKKSDPQSGQTQNVLIYGSTGAVGTAAVQIAKHYGATVTAVCGEQGVELTQSLGADTIVVYTKEDITKSTKQFDIIFDAVGKTSKKQCAPLLATGGKFVTVGGLDTASETKEQLAELNAMYENGELQVVIDKTFTLDEIVEAHRYVDTGSKKGNVVVTITS